MQRITAIFIIFLSNSVLLGQNFTGLVLDRNSESPISFAQVYFVDLKTGTTTDRNGIFKIDVTHQKKVHLQITYMGYDLVDTTIDVSTKNEGVFYLKPSHFHLEEAVVSTPSGVLQGENIVSIERRKINALQQAAPLTLAESLSNIPGVEQSSSGAGIGKPVIRGLSGNRIVTYAQGMRIENQQWGGEHGLGVGAVGIESVEVIKGPSSLLYGSDALGGVLYFVDERYANQNSVEGYGQTTFSSNTLGSTSSAGVKMNMGGLKFNMFGLFSSHADYLSPSFGRVFNARFDEKNLKSSMGFNTKNWVTNLRYSYLQNNFGIVEDSLYSFSTQRKLVLPYQNIANHNLSVENNIYASHSKVNLLLGFGSNYRKEFEEEYTSPSMALRLNTYTFNLKWYSPLLSDKFDFVLGTQGMRQSNLNTGQEVLIPNANTNDIGGFVLSNLKHGAFKFQGGLRFDFRQIYSQQLLTDEVSFPKFKKTYRGGTFSGGVVYQLERVKLRANISSGLRAPTSAELVSDGVHHGTNRYLVGNVNLTNENATQIDFSLDFQNEHLSFSVNPFYNFINHYIFLQPTELDLEGRPVFEYQQTNAFLYGGEAGVHYHPHKFHRLHLESNLSTVLAEDLQGNPLPLIPQTKVNSMASVEFSVKNRWKSAKVFVQHIYKFQQKRVGEFESYSKEYHLINIGMSIENSNEAIPIEIKAGIKNLLNSAYIDHLSRLKPLDIQGQGIGFYLKVRISFQTLGSESQN